jgi:hypothetical protein
LTDDRTQPPVRASRSSRKKKTSPALIAIPLVLVLGAAGLFYFLAGDGGATIPFIDGGDDQTEDVPLFEFKIRKTRAISTDEQADPDALAQQAAGVGVELTPMLDELFTNAFVDPSNWQEGDYTEVWERFDDASRPTAEQSVEALTLGATAGDVYDDVDPTKGSLEFDVLYDQEGVVTSVVVKFRFYAVGTRADGTYTSIVSHGQLFLDDMGSWEITAFTVKRDDKATESPAPPTPGPSGSASAPASAS